MFDLDVKVNPSMRIPVDHGLARAISALGLTASLVVARPALADNADQEEGAGKGADADAADKGDKATDEKGKDAAADPDAAKYDPAEETGKPYYFVGVRFRDAVVPKFMINIFADGGATVNVPMVGVEVTRRKDRFEFVFGLQYADYAMQPFLFKGYNEPDNAYEIVSSSLKQVLFTADLLYSVPLDKSGRLAFLVGGGIGIGGVFGNLYRSQAFPAVADPDPNNVKDWKGCPGDQAMPVDSMGVAYCKGSENDHFTDSRNGGKGYDEPSWAGGGSKPIVFPWLALPQLGLRYKPIKQLQARLDLGFSTSGFFFGLGASYGL
jgi:hypothetical protein